MTYEELKEKEMKLAEELKEIREKLSKIEHIRVIGFLEDAIKSLEEVNNSCLLSPNCYFEVYCDKCNIEYNTEISLEDVIQSLKDLKRVI